MPMPSSASSRFTPAARATLASAAFLLVCVGLIAPPAACAVEDTAPSSKPAAAPAEAAAASTVAELAQKARDSIVVITVQGREGTQHGLGTGFIVSNDGLIATNLHVIGEARPITVQTAKGDTLKVTAIQATERSRDLAVIRVDAKDLPALELADSEKLQQGQPIVVMGNPLGLKHSVVSGVVSGTREMEDRKMIQLAVPVEPGNSGGPVLDMQGRVCGIVTMKSLVTENLGFAAVVNDLKPLLDKPNPVPIDRWLTIGTLDAREWTTLGGARWHQRAGRILVDGGGSGFGGRSLCLSTDEPPELSFEVAVSVKMNDESGAAGLVFHSDGNDRHYGFYPSNGRLRLSRFEGPDVFSWKVLEEKPVESYRPGEWNLLKVRVEKEKLQCFVNGELAIESTDTGLTSGRVGLAKFRTTQAEFKHFQVGKQLQHERPTDKQAAEILAAIEDLPPLEDLKTTALSDLTATSGASVELLRQRAKELQARADELRRVASDVYAQGVVAELAKVAGPKVEEIDLLRASLLIARLDEEDVDVDAYVKQLDRMADEIKTKLPADADDEAKLKTLNQYLFVDNGFHGSRTDYYNRANSYLNRVIDDREGLPITLSVLYIELGKRLGLNIHGVGLPGHFIVRHVPAPTAKDAEPQLIDVFDSGAPLSRDEADKKVREPTGGPLTDDHLHETSARQILIRMLSNLIGVAQNKPDREAMLRYTEALLVLEPELVRERGLRAMLRFETGRKSAAIADLDWFLEHEPEGIDLDQIRRMQDFFRTTDPEAVKRQ